MILICTSADLIDAGKGVRFPVSVAGENTTGFVVRHLQLAQGYLNRCAHIGIELDWETGVFFESSGAYLMCSTHGALYAPESGHCLGGPCRGGRLRPIKIVEQDDQVFWQPDDYIKPPIPSLQKN